MPTNLTASWRAFIGGLAISLLLCVVPFTADAQGRCPLAIKRIAADTKLLAKVAKCVQVVHA